MHRSTRAASRVHRRVFWMHARVHCAYVARQRNDACYSACCRYSPLLCGLIKNQTACPTRPWLLGSQFASRIEKNTIWTRAWSWSAVKSETAIENFQDEFFLIDDQSLAPLSRRDSYKDSFQFSAFHTVQKCIFINYCRLTSMTTEHHNVTSLGCYEVAKDWFQFFAFHTSQKVNFYKLLFFDSSDNETPQCIPIYFNGSLRSHKRLISVLLFSHVSKMNFYKLLPFDIGDNETPYTHVAPTGCYEVTKVSHDQRSNRINRFASSSTKLHPLSTKTNYASPM